MEMIELKNDKMKQLLRKGLSIEYSHPSPVKDGCCRTLISDFVEDGKTYMVQSINDRRMNKGVPYVIVTMKNSEKWIDDWTHFLAKSLE